MANDDVSGEMLAVWVDREYDRHKAEQPGGSRYGEYVRADAGLFGEAWEREDRRAWVASIAWQIASAPFMEPGYISRHPRVFELHVAPCGWDGSLIVRLELITPQCEILTRSREWQGDRGWRDWLNTPWGPDHFDLPTDEQVLKEPYLLSSSVLMFGVPADALPDVEPVPLAGEDLVDVATRAVDAIADAINTAVSPAIATIEGS